MDSRNPLVKVSHDRPRSHRLFSLREQMRGVVKYLPAAFLDHLYPPVCLNCAAPVIAADGLCGGCWPHLIPITKPICPILGLPFDVDLGEGAVSAAALADPPPFERARSAVIYSDLARHIVARLKYGDQPELAQFCARLMVGAGADLLADNPVLVPVSLHRLRQWHRRYNQSSELCKAIARLTGHDMGLLLTHRTKRTRQQVGLTARQRLRNVEGAFGVNAREVERFAGRRLVLVDDVITTGATVQALTRVLKRHGFNHIDVLSFARVVIGADMPI